MQPNTSTLLSYAPFHATEACHPHKYAVLLQAASAPVPVRHVSRLELNPTALAATHEASGSLIASLSSSNRVS